MAERGVQVSYETIRRWCAKFGPAFALQLRKRRARPGDNWHLDEVAIRISGHRHWLWRAVDQHGVVLDILVQSRRNQHAAERFLRQVIYSVGYEPRVVITDKLASCPPAIRRVLPDVDHRPHKGLNNRAENSHLPVRKRERVLQRFKSTQHAQTFLSVFGPIGNHFRPAATASRPANTDGHEPRGSRHGGKPSDSTSAEPTSINVVASRSQSSVDTHLT
jgi:putative transposase